MYYVIDHNGVFYGQWPTIDQALFNAMPWHTIHKLDLQSLEFFKL
jgi:hypothetical protein